MSEHFEQGARDAKHHFGIDAIMGRFNAHISNEHYYFFSYRSSEISIPKWSIERLTDEEAHMRGWKVIRQFWYETINNAAMTVIEDEDYGYITYSLIAKSMDEVIVIFYKDNKQAQTTISAAQYRNGDDNIYRDVVEALRKLALWLCQLG